MSTKYQTRSITWDDRWRTSVACTPRGAALSSANATWLGVNLSMREPAVIEVADDDLVPVGRWKVTWDNEAGRAEAEQVRP